MPFSVIGLNHKTAPVSVRERLAYEGDTLERVLDELTQLDGIHEAVVVSTCNRSEFYCHSDRPSVLPQWICSQSTDIRSDEHVYQYHGEAAVEHLYRVACGLDSMILGEPQILGQLKGAYQTARDTQSAGYHLQRLFEQAFSCAKMVRSETGIGANPISIAYAAVRLSRQIFGDLSQQSALLIGAGETNELVARHLHASQIGDITIANRHVGNAQRLAGLFGGTGIGIADITKALPTSDIIVSSTASPLPILGKGTVETALRTRKHRPFFMVDIAVPRDIEPEVGYLEDVYLYNIDDLDAVIEENRQSRAMAACEAEAIIKIKAREFVAWQRSLGATYTIQQLRSHVDSLTEEALLKARKMLAQGKSPEEALQCLSHILNNKFLHAPFFSQFSLLPMYVL